MTRICGNCGYVNETADDTSVLCPKCGMPYAPTATITMPALAADAPALAADHASPFTVPNADYLTPPPSITTAGNADRANPAASGSRNAPRNLIIALAATLVIISALGGGFIVFASNHTPTAAIATATPQSTTPAKATALYIDPHGEFTITYLTEWTTLQGNFTLNGGTVHFTRFTSKHGTEGLVIGVSKSPLAYGDTAAIITHFGGTNYVVQSTAAIITAKNGSWQNVRATCTIKDQSAALFARSTTQSGINYLVIGFGPADQFDGQLMKTLNALFATLAPTAGA